MSGRSDLSGGEPSGRPSSFPDVAHRPSLGELGRVFLRLSLLGFGGPNVHLALMLDEVVERRRWLTRETFVDLMAVTNLLPGPNSSEMAIHVGYTQRGVPGALVTGLAFLLPAFFMVTGLAALYFSVGMAPSALPLLDTLRPVVLALIVHAGIKLTRTAATGRLLWVLAGAGIAVGWAFEAWVIPAMLTGGWVAWAAARRGAPGAPGGLAAFVPVPFLALPALPAVAAGAGWSVLGTAGTVLGVHLALGSVLFGGGYVLVALLEPLAVGRFGWLTAAQFLDGVAVTQAVPGPISTLSAFVGYAAAGVPGAVAGTVGIYLPAFVAVLVVAPHLERLRGRPGIKAALGGVGAVAAGTILGVAGRLLPGGIGDLVSALFFGGALVAAMRFKVAAVWLVAGGLLVGALRLLLG